MTRIPARWCFQDPHISEGEKLKYGIPGINKVSKFMLKLHKVFIVKSIR